MVESALEEIEVVSSADAEELRAELDARVDAVFALVQREPFWQALFSPSTSNKLLAAMLREVFLSVYWYQSHTTEAGYHMLGRLPKSEQRLLRSLLLHKTEEAEHGLWALRDYLALGGTKAKADGDPSPSTFAVAAVWWRMAVAEDPFGYIGAEHLFEYLTAKVTMPLTDELKRRGFALNDVGFVVEHATEDVKHTNLIRHWITDCGTRYPHSRQSMLRCFDYFKQVYPIPVWREAYARALAALD